MNIHPPEILVGVVYLERVEGSMETDRRGFLGSLLKGGMALASMGLVKSGCDVDFDEGETVLNRLLTHEEDVIYEVRQVNGRQHSYVTEIRGIREDQVEGLFWLYSVDGVIGTEAVDVCRVSINQEVVWRRLRPAHP